MTPCSGTSDHVWSTGGITPPSFKADQTEVIHVCVWNKHKANNGRKTGEKEVCCFRRCFRSTGNNERAQRAVELHGPGVLPCNNSSALLRPLTSMLSVSTVRVLYAAQMRWSRCCWFTFCLLKEEALRFDSIWLILWLFVCSVVLHCWEINVLMFLIYCSCESAAAAAALTVYCLSVFTSKKWDDSV